MYVSYDWYRVFSTTAECGNITLAAEKLYISQPAVSQCIKQLEKALKCVLFVRTAKGVRLTAEGSTLYQYVSKGIDLIKLGEKRLAAQLSFESGEITIGASDMTLEFCLLPYLEVFHKRHPGIRISITNGPTPETLKKLLEGTIDFGVVSESYGELDSDFKVIPVREIEDIFITSSKNREYYNLSFEDLGSIPLIMLERGTSTRKYVDAFLSEKNVSVLPEFELATSSLIVQFTKRNLGVGCVVRDFALEAMNDGSVIEVSLDGKIPPRRMCLIRRNEVVSRASEELLNLIIG